MAHRLLLLDDLHRNRLSFHSLQPRNLDKLDPARPDFEHRETVNKARAPFTAAEEAHWFVFGRNR